MKRFILLLVTLFAMTNVVAQLRPDMPIPADKEVRVGQLENGMTYYIRHLSLIHISEPTRPY